MPYFIGYIFNSYLNLSDIKTPAADIFKSPYDQRVLTLYNGTKSGDEINSQLTIVTVSYTHLRAHETVLDLVCRLLLEKKNK